MSTFRKMFRVILLPLLLCTISSMFCLGWAQTFQYSRGWTNGKRSLGGAAALGAHFHRDDDTMPDIFEMDDGDRKLEKCLVHLQRFVRNSLLLRSPSFASALSLNPGTSTTSNNNKNNNNNNNNLYANHHQSNDLYEELSGAEPSDYAKH